MSCVQNTKKVQNKSNEESDKESLAKVLHLANVPSSGRFFTRKELEWWKSRQFVSVWKSIKELGVRHTFSV